MDLKKLNMKKYIYQETLKELSDFDKIKADGKAVQ